MEVGLLWPRLIAPRKKNTRTGVPGVSAYSVAVRSGQRCCPAVLVVVALCLATVLTATPLRAAASEDDATVQSLSAELQQIRAELAALRQAVTEIHRATVVSKPVAAPAANAPAIAQVAINKTDPALGSADALVAIVEFTDYQCPYCARFNSQTFPELKTRYIDSGKVRYMVRDFPLEFHSNARAAAIAANCANEQGAYWAMRDRLFENQSELGESTLTRLASEAKLASQPWATCRTRAAAESADDTVSGAALGISGTPTFLVGRLDGNTLRDARTISGAQGVAAFAALIDPLLSSKPVN